MNAALSFGMAIPAHPDRSSRETAFVVLVVLFGFLPPETPLPAAVRAAFVTVIALALLGGGGHAVAGCVGQWYRRARHRAEHDGGIAARLYRRGVPPLMPLVTTSADGAPAVPNAAIFFRILASQPSARAAFQALPGDRRARRQEGQTAYWRCFGFAAVASAPSAVTIVLLGFGGWRGNELLARMAASVVWVAGSLPVSPLNGRQRGLRRRIKGLRVAVFVEKY